MLGKLLKYDFKWINNKVMLIYFAILFTITLLLKFVESLDQTFFVVIIDKILSGVFISCIVSVVITCFMRIWARFITNFYKDESYLTHTLPVKRTTLFNAKVIASFISLILTIIFIILCILLMYINPTTIDSIKSVYEILVSSSSNVEAILFIIGIFLLVVFEAFYMIMAGVFGITIGFNSNNHKVIKSIIYGLVSYLLSSLLTIGIIKVITSFRGIDIFKITEPTFDIIKLLLVTSICIYLIYNVIYYLISIKIFKNGVNID